MHPRDGCVTIMATISLAVRCLHQRLSPDVPHGPVHLSRCHSHRGTGSTGGIVHSELVAAIHRRARQPKCSAFGHNGDLARRSAQCARRFRGQLPAAAWLRCCHARLSWRDFPHVITLTYDRLFGASSGCRPLRFLPLSFLRGFCNKFWPLAASNPNEPFG